MDSQLANQLGQVPVFYAVVGSEYEKDQEAEVLPDPRHRPREESVREKTGRVRVGMVRKTIRYRITGPASGRVTQGPEFEAARFQAVDDEADRMDGI